MHILKENCIDWHKKKEVISELYTEHAVRVQTDQGGTGSVKTGRGAKTRMLCHWLYVIYTESTLPRKLFKGLETPKLEDN